MKTSFELEKLVDMRYGAAFLLIIGKAPKHKPYVKLETNIPDVSDYAIKDKDLERFAVNVLKALKSKQLKQ